MQAHSPAAPGQTLTFRLSVGVVVLMAFIQLICLGLALTMRLDRLGAAPREVVREVVRYVPADVTDAADVGAPASTEQPAAELDLAEFSGIVPVPADPAEPAEPVSALSAQPLPPPPGLKAPIIQDPLVAKLLAEARQARVAGDMRVAITKLKEAEKLAPDEPNVLYEAGMAYELMGIFDLASSYYQRVYELGTTGAGTLYQEAANKITAGFAQPHAERGSFLLGQTRIFKQEPPEGGQLVVITIPVSKNPKEDFLADDLEVKVTFFDQDETMKIQPIAAEERPQDNWLTAPVDWVDQREELLQITYKIAPPSVQDAHLFGSRKYYGQVVELFYKGELIDSQAWPRHLAQKLNASQEAPLFLEENTLPPDYNNQNPILPLPVR